MSNSIKDLKLTDFIPAENLKKYDHFSSDDSTLSEFIYDYLTSKPGFIKSDHANTLSVSKETEQRYIEMIREKTLTGKPVEIFMETINPKPRRKEITNGQVYPDMGEFLSIIHLTLIAKHIREIYNNGFHFVIAYEGVLHHFVSGSDTDVAYKTLSILRRFKELAEGLVGVREAVKIIDLQEVVSEYQDEFDHMVDEQIKEIYANYEDWEDVIESESEYFIDKVIDTDPFDTPEEAKEHAVNVSVRTRSFYPIRHKGGSNGKGFMNWYPNAIIGSTKNGRVDTEYAIQLELLPGTETYPYNQLTVKTKTGKWDLKEWKDMGEEHYEPVFFKEFEHPMYFKEK